MNAENIQILLKKLGCEKVYRSGDWVYSSCPLALYKHPSRSDRHPSFSVSVEEEGRSGARCHACNYSGSLMELMYTLERASSKRYGEQIAFVEANNGMTYGSLIEGLRKKMGIQTARAAKYEEARKNGTALPPPPDPVWDPTKEVAGITGVQMNLMKKLGERDLQVLPENTLERFKPLTGEVLAYVEHERRLTPSMIQRWELKWDRQYGRIVIPVRDCKQRLVGHSGRAFSENLKPKYMHAKGFRRDFYLYGENLWEEGKGGTCCVVEGFFDVHRLVDYGYKAGAMMGSYLSEFQIEKLVRFFDKALIVPDGDKPGYDAAKKNFEMLSVRMPAHIVPTPWGQDPDDYSRSEALELLGSP